MSESLRDLMEEYLLKVFNGTAHPHRKQVLEDFILYVEGREKFNSECDQIVSRAFASIPGLERVTE